MRRGLDVEDQGPLRRYVHGEQVTSTLSVSVQPLPSMKMRRGEGCSRSAGRRPSWRIWWSPGGTSPRGYVFTGAGTAASEQNVKPNRRHGQGETWGGVDGRMPGPRSTSRPEGADSGRRDASHRDSVISGNVARAKGGTAHAYSGGIFGTSRGPSFTRRSRQQDDLGLPGHRRAVALRRAVHEQNGLHIKSSIFEGNLAKASGPAGTVVAEGGGIDLADTGNPPSRARR